MNHEFWNEIGNLYFMFGAYEPAIHAYLRSIKLDCTFGRSYSNLAMAYVQTGKYRDAINLYRRSIELLSDDKEKANTWNKLGILYRQIREYDNALEAYQRADLIAPAQAETESRGNPDKPLTVSIPNIDLASILAKGNFAQLKSPFTVAEEVNMELEMAEADRETSEANDALPPDFETYFMPDDMIVKPQATTHDEWKLAYAEAMPLVESPEAEEVESLPEAPAPAEIIAEIKSPQMESPAPAEEPPVQLEEEDIQLEAEEDPGMGIPASEDAPQTLENPLTGTNTETPEYTLVEYALNDLNDIPPEEQKRLDLEIVKYQQATAANPHSYVLWMGLGEAYKATGDYRDAIPAFQKAITLNPSNFMCHYHLGLVYAAEQRTQEAVRAFQKTLELNQGFAQAHASLASQYRLLGAEKAAQVHIEKARAQQLEGESEYNRACLEAICGNKEHALDLLEAALQSKQTYINWVQKDPDFSSLRGDRRFREILSTYALATP